MSVAQAKLDYREFLKRMWLSFDPRKRTDAVLTANFGYFAVQELMAALEDLGVAFIALHKELAWTTATQSHWGKPIAKVAFPSAADGSRLQYS